MAGVVGQIDEKALLGSKIAKSKGTGGKILRVQYAVVVKNGYLDRERGQRKPRSYPAEPAQWNPPYVRSVAISNSWITRTPPIATSTHARNLPKAFVHFSLVVAAAAAAVVVVVVVVVVRLSGFGS
ncbi:hypothetical protein B0T20DRAFT_398121 [Sordaria brevicollis]|uniref:Uncharacterized protein n=1 Tax=Sordaria brevicollis TaxID=83679 RepID=A0AAE0U2F4_SORBR|nr:hypothetical protein B0T20DRAFT_398121 [Sordaria brevicollis]